MATKKKTEDDGPEGNAVEAASKATPIEPGEPQEADAITQAGSTFAERAKARAAAEKRIRSANAEDKAVKSSAAKTKAKS